MSLSDNEKTGFKARELKSVHVDAIGVYLKLVIHKNHINKHNLYNQVGIIAVNVIGDGLNADDQVGDSCCWCARSSQYLAPVPRILPLSTVSRPISSYPAPVHRILTPFSISCPCLAYSGPFAYMLPRKRNLTFQTEPN